MSRGWVVHTAAQSSKRRGPKTDNDGPGRAVWRVSLAGPTLRLMGWHRRGTEV